MKWLKVHWGVFISAIIGIIISVASFRFIHIILQQPGKPDSRLIYLGAAGIFFGALLIVPTIVISVLKQLLSIIGPYIPVIGGRRVTDPPAPPGTPTGGGPT